VKVSDYIADTLSAQGVTHVFEVVGGMITHLIDSIERQGRIRLVSMHHEQGAAFAADATGRMTGVPGVAMATSGPGATNLLTGIGSSYFDSSPTVFITGQVNRHEQKGDRAIRQLGFQEADIVSMATPITKAAWRVDVPEDVPTLLTEAFRLATSGRPGPVLLDIPMDVQRAQINDVPEASACSYPSPFDPTVLQEVFAALDASRRPLILAGGGVRAAQAAEPFRRLVEALGVPVVSSLMGTDLLPWDHPLRVGFIGSYGNRWANMAIGRSDLLLVLGSRLDIRQTGAETAAFKGDRAIIHVDQEVGEINNRVVGCDPIVAHLRPFLTAAAELARNRRPSSRSEWEAELRDLDLAWPDTEELNGVSGINPNLFMHELSHASRNAATFVVDVGQHQMWAAQSLEVGADQRFLTSGGMGAMGFALPAAIGAALAHPDRPTVMIAGDGSFQLNIQELQTVVRNRLPLKMVVLDNGCHGMVRQFQQSYFEERYQSTYWGYSAPDFADVAAAYGIEARTVEHPEDATDALEWLCRDPSAPALLRTKITPFANVYPKIAFGRPITEMEPFAKPIAMEGT
jgi:acetolactate synthase-1/2/3 large subunit